MIANVSPLNSLQTIRLCDYYSQLYIDMNKYDKVSNAANVAKIQILRYCKLDYFYWSLIDHYNDNNFQQSTFKHLDYNGISSFNVPDYILIANFMIYLQL